MTRPRVPGLAARRAMLERKYRPLPGEDATDRRTYAQRTGLERYHREPGAESPAELVRRLAAERPAPDAPGPPGTAQDAPEGPDRP